MAGVASTAVRRRQRARRRSPRPVGLLISGVAIVAALAGVVLFLLLVAPPPPQLPDVPGRMVAGDLVLELQDSGWITHDDIGGPVPSSVANGFQMPASMMPGMPDAGIHRLYLEAVLSDTGSGTAAYAPREFSVRAPDGGTWPLDQPATFVAGSLARGQTRSLDMLFDVPDTVSRLDLVWTHEGQLLSTAVGAPPPPIHDHGT